MSLERHDAFQPNCANLNSSVHISLKELLSERYPPILPMNLKFLVFLGELLPSTEEQELVHRCLEFELSIKEYV